MFWTHDLQMISSWSLYPIALSSKTWMLKKILVRLCWIFLFISKKVLVSHNLEVSHTFQSRQFSFWISKTWKEAFCWKLLLLLNSSIYLRRWLFVSAPIIAMFSVWPTGTFRDVALDTRGVIVHDVCSLQYKTWTVFVFNREEEFFGHPLISFLLV